LLKNTNFAILFISIGNQENNAINIIAQHIFTNHNFILQ